MQSETLPTHAADAAAPDEESAFTRQLPVLGIPVSYESERSEVLDVVADALGAWRSMERVPWLVETRGVHIRIVVDDDDAAATWTDPVSGEATIGGGVNGVGAGDGARDDGDRAARRGAVGQGTEDDVRRFARVRVGRAMLGDPQQFGHGPVEAVTLALLERFDRAPVNAAAVCRDGTAVLLVGPPGAGKRFLLYAAARAGLKVLSDERVYVQTRPELRVWGLPGSLHLPASAATHFPELAGMRPLRLADGTSPLVLDVERLGALPDSPLARRVGVCLVRRDDGSGPEFARVHPERILMELSETPAAGGAHADDMIALIGRLAERGAWVLNVSGPPSALIPRIETMLEALVAQPAAVQQADRA